MPDGLIGREVLDGRGPSSPSAAIADALIAEVFRKFWVPDPLTVAEWADGRLILPLEMSAEPGPIRLSRTPYLRRIFEDLADPSVEEVVLMFATQLGKTTALLALMAYVIDHDPAPLMLVLPTVEVSRRFSHQRVAPLIDANQCLSEKVADVRSRRSSNTIWVKKFRDGMLVITGANSAPGLASMPSRVVLFDEVDDYPETVGSQGSPIALATARQDTFANRKRIKSSSPKQPKGSSVIERAWETGSRGEYYVPCPHCGEFQTLRWGQLQWTDDDPATAAYACVGCGSLIAEADKAGMLEAGEWRDGNPTAKVRSYRLNSLYSPLGWLGWGTLVAEFVAASKQMQMGNLAPLRAFVNTRLAETWEEQAEKLAANDLEERAEDFPLGTVPADGLLVVGFVDVQDDRFEVGTWALGEGDQMWTVDHRSIPANPGLEADWVKLDAALRERFPHALGGSLPIEAAAIDTGGHFTHDVYRYVRRVPSARKIAATKGMDRPQMPILGRASKVDVNWQGGVIKAGVKLWMVGVNSAKDLLFARIRSGRVHFSAELGSEWFEQLAAEHRIAKRTPHGLRHVWVKKASGARNEALDIAVGAIWVGERLGVSRWTPKYWQRLREGLKKRAEEKPADAVAKSEAPEIPSAQQRALKRTPWPIRPRGSGNYVTGWK